MRNSLVAAGIALVTGAMGAQASASTVFSLDVISTSNIGTGSQGTVTLTQNGADEVDVVVSLATNVLLVNTGGPHTPFTFDLASAVSGATVTVTSVNTPGTFFAATGTQKATPDGSFTNGIGYNGSNGGIGHGSAGPLDFSVVDASGITISDFIENSSGYYFAADVLGTGGNTGTVAANTGVSTTPLPSTWTMMIAALAGFGFMAYRGSTKKSRGLATVAAA